VFGLQKAGSPGLQVLEKRILFVFIVEIYF